MSKLTWKGGTGDWYDPRKWLTASDRPGVPVPGDEVVIGAGRVGLLGSEARNNGSFDDHEVKLGTAILGRAAQLDFINAVSGTYFDVAVPSGNRARIVDHGTSGCDGSLDVRGDLHLHASSPALGKRADFVFTSDALLTVHNTGSLEVDGAVKLETPPGQSVVKKGGSLAVDGSLSLVGGTLAVSTGATLTGTGAVHLGYDSKLSLQGTSTARLSVEFDDPGAILKIGDVGTFRSSIVGFSIGDTIDLTNMTGSYAAFSPDTNSIEVRQGGADGAIVAELPMSGSEAGQLLASPDGKGGTEIADIGSRSPIAYNIGTADQVLKSDIVRSTMTTAGGAPIDGTGVKIGIVSDSFDATGTADAAASAGYLPYDPQTGTPGVTVLKDDPEGSDEGQAMAELIIKSLQAPRSTFAQAGTVSHRRRKPSRLFRPPGAISSRTTWVLRTSRHSRSRVSSMPRSNAR